MDRYQKLVFSFYREDLKIQSLLGPLQFCKIMRSWGAIQIDCIDKKHLEDVMELIDYLIPPFSSLRLCRYIVLSAPGCFRKYDVQETHSSTDLLA